MKELKNFLFESVANIFEAATESFLLSNYDDAVTWFNEYKLFENKKLIEMGVNPDVIKQLYEWAETESMPCPIVANYQRKPGKFVFRRWIAKHSDDLEMDIFKNHGPYQGLHNTNLREDGKYFPSAEDYEFAIAYSHNKNTMEMVDPANIEFVAQKQMESNSKLEQLMVFYVQNEESCKRMSAPLAEIKSELYKLPNVKSATKEWKTLGNYKKDPNKTPKTDIISKDGKYRISLKKAKDGSQLMSGGECESRATLMSCIDYLKSEDDKNLLRELCALEWKTPSKTGQTAKERRKAGDTEILSIDAYNKDLSSKLNNIIVNNPDFKRAVMYEAATGEIKFGKGAPASANYVFVWDDVSNNNHLYTVDEYIDSKVNFATFSIGFKTAKDIGIAMRIIVK